MEDNVDGLVRKFTERCKNYRWEVGSSCMQKVQRWLYILHWLPECQLEYQQYGTFANFKKTWTATVHQTKGLILWKDVLKANKILWIPNGKCVQVLHKKLWYAKVKYQGKYGFVNKKYLK